MALKVWQRGHSTVFAVYRLSVGFPSTERHGLLSELRRAALSVPPNIAEGSKPATRQEYARFLSIAEASLAETEYLPMVSRDLGYITPQQAVTTLRDVSEPAGMSHGLGEKVHSAR